MSSKRRPAPQATPTRGPAAPSSAIRPGSPASGEATRTLVPPGPAAPSAPSPAAPTHGPPNGRTAAPSGAPARNGQVTGRKDIARAVRKTEQGRVATTGPTARSIGRRPRRRGRRVHRVIRRIDLWSVLKLSLVLFTCVYASVLMATAGLWAFLNSSGLVTKFESFMKDVGFNNWQFHGPQMFKGVAAGGAVLVLAFSLLSLVFAGLVNVVSELTGGIRITVIEEEPSSGYRRRVNPTLAEWEASQQGAGTAPAAPAVDRSTAEPITTHSAGTPSG